METMARPAYAVLQEGNSAVGASIVEYADRICPSMECELDFIQKGRDILNLVENGQ
jgi:hypothetical protein